MQVGLEPRAEVALRSLANVERAKVEQALRLMSELDRHSLSGTSRVQRLAGLQVRDLYSYKASDRLRIVFSFQGDRIVVQDIANRERLKHLTGGLG
jgi:mRNA-degrading endonuclease RelE of RelBE toxin-antitoxin system